MGDRSAEGKAQLVVSDRRKSARIISTQQRIQSVDIPAAHNPRAVNHDLLLHILDPYNPQILYPLSEIPEPQHASPTTKQNTNKQTNALHRPNS